MVVGAFPIAKLSVLLVKQISKPIANICKERAKNSPFFRTYVCMPPAQFYNWCEVKAKMWILNLGKPVNIPVLSQDMAIELGANLLGEGVIFFIGSALLIFEYNRQSKNETAKEEKRLAELNHISSTITDLYFTVQQQQTQIREMERIVHTITGVKPKIPPPPPTPSGFSPSPPSTAPPTASSTPIKLEGPGTQNVDNVNNNTVHIHKVSSIPYPDNGIILQSLNYIQMDAFSSVFVNNNQPANQSKEDKATKPTKEKEHQLKCDKAVVSTALYNIENNFKSLF